LALWADFNRPLDADDPKIAKIVWHRHVAMKLERKAREARYAD
jgi:hypothetical protein